MRTHYTTLSQAHEEEGNVGHIPSTANSTLGDALQADGHVSSQPYSICTCIHDSDRRCFCCIRSMLSHSLVDEALYGPVPSILFPPCGGGQDDGYVPSRPPYICDHVLNRVFK